MVQTVEHLTGHVFPCVPLSVMGLICAKRLLGKTVARYLPLVGAAAVARYAYVDTKQVGHAAMMLFSKEVIIQEVGEA